MKLWDATDSLRSPKYIPPIYVTAINQEHVTICLCQSETRIKTCRLKNSSKKRVMSMEKNMKKSKEKT